MTEKQRKGFYFPAWRRACLGAGWSAREMPGKHLTSLVPFQDFQDFRELRDVVVQLGCRMAARTARLALAVPLVRDAAG